MTGSVGKRQKVKNIMSRRCHALVLKRVSRYGDEDDDGILAIIIIIIIGLLIKLIVCNVHIMIPKISNLMIRLV